MIEVSRARNKDAHTVMPCFLISQQEIKFVLNFPGLNDLEKLVWIVLAALAAQNPDFTSQCSLQQFAKMLGKRPKSILCACKQLEAMGIVSARAENLRFSHMREQVLINLLPKKAKEQSTFASFYVALLRFLEKTIKNTIRNMA
jgi:hypothetical protein